MRCVRANEQAVVFALSAREHEFLVQLLQTYPVVPPAHQPLSKGPPDPRLAEYQRLLDEALSEQRAANHRQLHAWLATPGRFQTAGDYHRFTVERTDGEWLLQVLNDVRVGHWLRLGSPETEGLTAESVDARQFFDWQNMDLSGYFQMTIMRALED